MIKAEENNMNSTSHCHLFSNAWHEYMRQKNPHNAQQSGDTAQKGSKACGAKDSTPMHTHRPKRKTAH